MNYILSERQIKLTKKDLEKQKKEAIASADYSKTKGLLDEEGYKKLIKEINRQFDNIMKTI